jgi:hypothetical protein
MSFIAFPLAGGGEIFISPASVFRVTAEFASGSTRVDAGSDSPVVTVSVGKVISLLDNAGVKLVELRRPEGTSVYLNVAQISVVRGTQGGDPDGTKAVVMVAGKRQALALTPREAHDAIVAVSAPSGAGVATS